LNATAAETFRAILTAYAESDMDPYAKHPTDDTWGLFQQNPKWWGTREQILDPVYACTSFVSGRPGLPALRKITLSDDPVVDCWRVQKWGRNPDGSPINPDADLAAFRAHPSTQNYTRRLGVIQTLIDNPEYFDGVVLADEPRIMAVGGAVTSRGVVWLDDLPGVSPAEKLRAAWTPGSQDRRCIIASHGTVLDVGSNPIPVPAGVCLAGPGGPQTEFSDQGRVFLRGMTSAFRSVDSGSNYSGTKGWSFVNIGFEGTSGLNLFAPNPMNASGPIMAYASIEGCSFDNFRTIVESPLLGCHWDIRYLNNVSGPYAFKLAGSDCQLWTHGGKLDWGQGNPDNAKVALVILAGLEKSTIGGGDTSGGLYLTCEKGAGLQVEGGSSRGGVDLFGVTLEGRNANQPAQGAVYRQTGNSVNFFGGNVNYAMSNTAAQGRGDRASADISGGVASFHGTRFRRGSSTAPFIARRGTGIVDTFGCREVPSNALVTAVNL
jgi:hypothetical protein